MQCLSQTHSSKIRKTAETTSFTEYITDTEHIKGQQNIVTDCLSQPTLANDVNLCDLQAIVNVQAVHSDMHNFSNLKIYNINDNLFVMCNASTSFPRPYIPTAQHKAIFDSIHSISYAVLGATIKMIKAWLFWLNIDNSETILLQM